MVGVPKSTGCSTCIKRRVKCDETKPACGNCVKYAGATTCPGYNRNLKFVVAKTHRARRPRNRPVESIMRSSPSKSLPPSFDFSTSREETFAVTVTQSHDSFDFFASIPPVIKSPETYQLQMISTLVESCAYSDLPVISLWISYLPPRFGKSKALDSAMICFATQQMSSVCDDQGMVLCSRAGYSKALIELQKSLNDPSRALSSETQCAAMLLCVYELFTGTTAYNSWTKHASGIARLMQARGPDQFHNEFDHAMLVGFRGIIITDCIFSGKGCFLTKEDWQSVARARSEFVLNGQLHNFIEDMVYYMSLIPELLRDGFNIREARKMGEPDPLTPEAIEQLGERTFDLYGRFRAWGESLQRIFPFPEEVLSPSNDPVFPVVYHYNDGRTLTIYTAWWSCMLIIQEILRVCGQVPDGALDRFQLVGNICKSVELTAQGKWGGYKMGMALRIAWEATDSLVQNWITDWLQRFSKHYAATSPEQLPKARRHRNTH